MTKQLIGNIIKKGEKGDQGIQGIQGKQGEQGAKGDPGSKSLIRGTVNNIEALPTTDILEGDCYFIKDIGDLYSYLNSEWIKVGNLKGPIGTTLISILPFDSLDSITSPEQGILYIIPHAGGTNPNVYDEYFYIESSAQFEQIGQQEMDLSGYCLKADYYTKIEINTSLNSKADVTTTYTKTEVDTNLGLKANTSDVYSKTESDTNLNSKANTSDVYSKTDTYSKTEVDTSLGLKANSTDVYSKAEIDALLGTANDIITG